MQFELALTSTLKSLIEEQTGINEQGGIFCLLGVIQQLPGHNFAILFANTLLISLVVYA